MSRRTALGLIAALAGCAGGESTTTPQTDNPAMGSVTQMGELTLSSPAFEASGEIPARYGRQQENLNPPLRISGVPQDTASFTLIMDDPDAVEPAGHVWLHWLVWNIPPDHTDIPEGWTPSSAVEGVNDFGTTGYGGPDPPSGTHTYRFKLYALEHNLDLSREASKEAVGEAMVDSRLAQTQLTGTYSA